jgi:tetratricopeptide (TPR) repeat protein
MTGGRRHDASETIGGTGETVPARPSAFDAGWAEAGRYALVSELARGGGGRIAVAVDRKLGRRVAVKRPLERAGNSRLEREAFVLARLEHPSIVPIHDAGCDPDGTPFYTMKLVDGETLAARIDRAAAFDERLALLATVTAVAEAVAYAHAQGVIHRDLKPANVLVGGFGEVIVIDWGLGKLIDEPSDDAASDLAASTDLTGHSSVVGTPAYMAPEQAAGRAVDRRADVYALGAMLYHVLVGDLPYAGANAEATLAQLLAGPPPAIDAREPRVPRDLAALVGKAMARDPDHRYPSAAELAEDLRRYRNGRLVAAHRYRPGTRAWRAARRHPGGIAVAIGALALASAGWAFVRASERSSPDQLCAGVDRPIRDVWNPGVAGRIERAFTATGGPRTLASWRVVVADLDARADRIAAMRTSACRAARTPGDQRALAIELQMTCLDRQTIQLGNFVTWLAGAERDTVQHAPDSLSSLSRVEDCADLAHLRDLMPMPTDPARRAEIAQIDGELDHVMTMARAGSSVAADRLLPALVQRAEATRYEPVRARALYCRAQLLKLQTRTSELLTLIEEGLLAAERAGAHRLRADLLTLRLDTEFNTLEHIEVAASLAEQVRAIGERIHDPEVMSTALGYLGQIEARLQHLDDAVRHAEQAVALIAEPNSRKGWGAQGRLATVYLEANRLADARRVLTQLIASRRSVIGNADDPHLAGDLENLAVVYDNLGDEHRAYEILTEAVGMFDRTLPADADARIEAYTNYAALQGALGHWAEARTNLEALLPVAEAKDGHDQSEPAQIVFRIAEANEQLHHYEDALAGYRDARARHVAATLPLWVVKSQRHIGSNLLALGRPKEARIELEAAVAEMTRLGGPDSSEAASCRGELGRVLVRLGEPRRAVPELERALAVLDREDDRAGRGRYHMTLAMAHRDLGHEPQALDHAKQARALLEQSSAKGTEGNDDLAQLDAWERAHH